MIEDLIKIANFESNFYIGNLFQFDVSFLQSNIQMFTIHPILFSLYFATQNLGITKFPEFQTNDFYHNKNQSHIFEYKIGKVNIDQMRHSIRAILYIDMTNSNHPNGIYYNKLLQFFGPNQITQIL